MAFSTRFLAHFTDEEQKSELVQLVALQGDNIEAAILEQLNKELLQATELIAFPEARLRSWLSYFLKDVGNVTSASGSVTVTVEEAENPVLIPSGSVLSTSTGVSYVQQSDLYLTPGSSGTVEVVQGETSTSTGTYNEFISISSSTVDLDRISVYVGETEVSACEVVEGYVVPLDGYYASYYNGTLIIKIFKGDNTPDPDGQGYTVVLWSSKGTGGNVTANAFTGYDDTITDIYGLPVTLSIANESIQSGADAPSTVDLVHQLRTWFFVKTSVSSIPEYESWFRDQSEIGDCIVEGDFERYLRSSTNTVSVTGKVYVAAIDPDGVAISKSVMNTLESRIEDVKDIGIIEWVEPVEVKSYIEVKYVSTTDTTGFLSVLESTLTNYYTLDWLLEQDLSLFDDLDFEDVRETIGTTYGQSGMEFVPYHFYADDNVCGTTWTSPSTAVYTGESDDGYYLVYKRGEDDLFESEPFMKLVQYPQPDGSVPIYVEYDNDGKASEGDYMGYRQDGIVYLDQGYAFEDNSRIECYWAIENPGILPVGSTYGYRSLAGYSVTKVSSV